MKFRHLHPWKSSLSETENLQLRDVTKKFFTTTEELSEVLTDCTRTKSALSSTSSLHSFFKPNLFIWTFYRFHPKAQKN